MKRTRWGALASMTVTATATAAETSHLNINLSFVKLNRVNYNSLRMSNVGEFPWI